MQHQWVGPGPTFLLHAWGVDPTHIPNANRDVELAALVFVVKFSGSLAEVGRMEGYWDAAGLEHVCCSEGAIAAGSAEKRETALGRWEAGVDGSENGRSAFVYCSLGGFEARELRAMLTFPTSTPLSYAVSAVLANMVTRIPTPPPSRGSRDERC